MYHRLNACIVIMYQPVDVLMKIVQANPIVEAGEANVCDSARAFACHFFVRTDMQTKQ